MMRRVHFPESGCALASLALALFFPWPAPAQGSSSNRDQELRYVEGLRKLGLPDYAEMVLKRLGGGAGVDRIKLDLMLSRGQHAEVKAYIARQSNQDSQDAWDLKIRLADSYFAWGKPSEGRALYDSFFKTFATPPDAMKEFYMNAAYRYAQLLLLANQPAAAILSYSNAIKGATAPHVVRQINSEMADVLLKVAQEEPDAAKREGSLKQVERIANDLLWVQDLWFGKAIVMLAHVKMIRGDLDGATKLIEKYKEQLLGIDESLKQDVAEGREDLTRLSPMAQCRYLLAVIMQQQAEKLLESGKDKPRALELLAGKKDMDRRIPGAIQHYLNVFIRYPSTPWAPDAGARLRQVEKILQEKFGKTVDFKVTPAQWAVVEKSQLGSAQSLFNEGKFAEAADSYLRILNAFPDTDGALPALNNLCRCYIELDNELYAATVLHHLAERFSRREDSLTKAGDIVLGIADFYAERQKPEMKAAIYDLFFQHFQKHAQAAALLYRFAQERMAADDIPAALAYFQRVERDYSNAPAYFSALSGLSHCYNKTGNTEAEVKTLNKLLAGLEKQSRPGHIYVNAKLRLASAYRRLDPKYLSNALNRYVEVIKLLTGDVTPYQNSAEEAKANARLLEQAMYYRAFCFAMLPPPEGKPEVYYKEEAVKAFEALLQKFPKSEMAPGALSQIGTLWTILQKPEEAQKAFSRLQKEYPDSPEAQNAKFLLGMNLLKLGMRQKAIEVFKEMFSGSGTYKDSQILTAGNELLKAGEYEIALEAYDKVLASGTKDRALREPAIYGKGVALVATGQLAEGIKTLEALLAEFKNSGYTVEAALALSRAYCELGSKEPDADKRYTLFANSVNRMKTVRLYSKEPGQRAESAVAVARTFVRQAEASEQFGPKEMAKEYRNDAIAAFQILMMTGELLDPKVAPHIETAYHECIPLMLDAERWQDVFEDCDRYFKTFPRGKYLPDIGTWMNKARSKLATQTAPPPAP